MKKITLKRDRYRKSRGGYSWLLDISCEKCGKHVCYYQKDGPGILKRMYVDRISEIAKANFKANLVCPKCKEILGVSIIYKKEKRPAYKLFVGAVNKKIIKS